MDIFNESSIVFSSNKDQFDQVSKTCTEEALNHYVSLFDVKVMLGFYEDTEMDRILHREDTFYGWGPNGKEFHRATEKDLHPDKCPCCGKPW